MESDRYLRHVEEKLERARRQVESARERLAQAEGASRFWNDLEGYLRRNHPANAALLLRTAAGYVRSLHESRDPVAQVLDEIRAEAQRDAASAAASFGRLFPEAVRKAGLEIDATSRHPRYTLKQGFVRVEFNERELTAKIVPRDGEEIVLGMDIDPVVERLKREVDRIFGRPQPESLLRSVYTAYVAALRTEARPEGEEIPLRRLTNRLAKNLNRFAADEFNVDLSRLIAKGDLVIDGRRMHLNHTRNARQGMLLHGFEEGGYVGFVSFKEAP